MLSVPSWPLGQTLSAFLQNQQLVKLSAMRHGFAGNPELRPIVATHSPLISLSRLRPSIFPWAPFVDNFAGFTQESLIIDGQITRTPYKSALENFQTCRENVQCSEIWLYIGFGYFAMLKDLPS